MERAREVTNKMVLLCIAVDLICTILNNLFFFFVFGFSVHAVRTREIFHSFL